MLLRCILRQKIEKDHQGKSETEEAKSRDQEEEIGEKRMGSKLVQVQQENAGQILKGHEEKDICEYLGTQGFTPGT